VKTIVYWKIRPIILTILILATITLPAAATSKTDAFFPDMTGWKKTEGPTSYAPDSLYQYINGAAEVYLSYDFRELTVVTYENANEDSITIEIYRHATPNDGFGIYSQEKPRSGSYLKIGAEGYGESILLNFVQGHYYVKINFFGDMDSGQKILASFADAVSARISDKKKLPPVLKCFPHEGIVAHSKRYVAKNFLGHKFLHSAFAAEYMLDGQTSKAFIIQLNTHKDAVKMISQLLKLGGVTADSPVKEGTYSIKTKYIGELNVQWRDTFIWGTMGGTPKLQSTLKNQIFKKLKKMGFLK